MCTVLAPVSYTSDADSRISSWDYHVFLKSFIQALMVETSARKSKRSSGVFKPALHLAVDSPIAPRPELPDSGKFLPSDTHSDICTNIRESFALEMDSHITIGFEQRIPHTQEKELPGNANWVVQKYGGTSLGKFATQIAEDIIK